MRSSAGSGELLRGTTDWLRVNCKRFDLFRDGPDPSCQAEKALAELAILCRQFVVRGTHTCIDIEPLFSLLWAVYTNPLFMHRLRRVDDALVPHALVADALRHKGGLLSPQISWQTLQDVCDRSNVTFVERPAHRLLELRRVLDSANLRHGLPSYSDLSRRSTLGRPINPIHLTDYDIYSITHTLFFLTDFGRFPVRGLTPARRRRAHDIVDDLIGMQVYRGNYDMVGELLLSAHCLNSRRSEFYDAGWDALLAAKWCEGAVPGPNYRRDLHSEALVQGVAEAEAYVFDNCYHTTLVAALVGAMCEVPIKQRKATT